MPQVTSWTDKLQTIPDSPYLRSENGNIYCHHCLFMQSGPLHAKQISDCLLNLLGHPKFVINTILTADRYACKTYVWFDDEKDFERIMSGEIVIPPIPLNEDQIASVPEKELIDGNSFSVVVSPTFITPGMQENKRDDQFFINNIGPPPDSEELLHHIFDRFCISLPNRKVKITINEKSDRNNRIDSSQQYWALIDFDNKYDCAFAYRLTHSVTCRDRSGKVYNLLVNYGKILGSSENDKYRRRKYY